MRRGPAIAVLLVSILLLNPASVLAAPLSTREIAYGSSGKEVLECQRLLKSLGYDPGPADGIFGDSTLAAVRAFQKASGLPVDGIIGPETARSLAEAEKRAKSPLSGKTIVLDPGHGGSNPGAVGALGTKEADNVLAIALELESMLRDLGARVMMTRWSDTEASPAATTRTQELSARAGLANSTRANLFISIHNNAYEKDPSVSGVMAFHDGGSEDSRLAQALLKGVSSATGLAPLGVETAAFRVLKDARVPSCLMEIGFMTNLRDERLLSTSSFRKKAARGLLNGIMEFLRLS